MVKGWFIGAFEPTLYASDAVEVAVKRYERGDSEAAHFHKIAREFTVIISGTVRMNNILYHEGCIIVVEPGEITDFEAVTNAVTTVVKIPGVLNDKYLAHDA